MSTAATRVIVTIRYGVFFCKKCKNKKRESCGHHCAFSSISFEFTTIFAYSQLQSSANPKYKSAKTFLLSKKNGLTLRVLSIASSIWHLASMWTAIAQQILIYSENGNHRWTTAISNRQKMKRTFFETNVLFG